MTMTEERRSPSIAPLEDVQRDLSALRNDVSRLTQEVTNYVSTSGRKAVRDANERVGQQRWPPFAVHFSDRPSYSAQPCCRPRVRGREEPRHILAGLAENEPPA